MSPDDGYASKLTPEEYKTYQAYREKRDSFGIVEEKGSGEADEAAKVAAFVDKPVQLAAEHLKGT